MSDHSRSSKFGLSQCTILNWFISNLSLEYRPRTKNELNLVFPTPEGKPEKRNNVYRRFVTFAAKIGHKGMRFHDLRHTHATILLADGEMVNAVSQRLGHANVSTTLEIYGHVLPKKAEETARIETNKIISLFMG